MLYDMCCILIQTHIGKRVSIRTTSQRLVITTNSFLPLILSSILLLIRLEIVGHLVCVFVRVCVRFSYLLSFLPQSDVVSLYRHAGCVLLYLFHKDPHYKLPNNFAKTLKKTHQTTYEKNFALYNPFKGKCRITAQEEVLAGLLGMCLSLPLSLSLSVVEMFVSHSLQTLSCVSLILAL